MISTLSFHTEIHISSLLVWESWYDLGVTPSQLPSLFTLVCKKIPPNYRLDTWHTCTYTQGKDLASILYLKGSRQLLLSLGAETPSKEVLLWVRCLRQLNAAVNCQYDYHSEHICCLFVIVLWLPSRTKPTPDDHIREVALSSEAVTSATATCSRWDKAEPADNYKTAWGARANTGHPDQIKGNSQSKKV